MDILEIRRQDWTHNWSCTSCKCSSYQELSDVVYGVQRTEYLVLCIPNPLTRTGSILTYR
jgi:hypothetical protein